MDTQASNVTSTVSHGKKTSKPMMERKRRARINASLAELKSLVVDANSSEIQHHNKLEKADILEMAVDHLTQLQKQEVAPHLREKMDPSKYRLGFKDCAMEVGRFFEMQESLKTDIQIKILNHLANILTTEDTIQSQHRSVIAGGGAESIDRTVDNVLNTACSSDYNSRIAHSGKSLQQKSVSETLSNYLGVTNVIDLINSRNGNVNTNPKFVFENENKQCFNNFSLLVSGSSTILIPIVSMQNKPVDLNPLYLNFPTTFNFQQLSPVVEESDINSVTKSNAGVSPFPKQENEQFNECVKYDEPQNTVVSYQQAVCKEDDVNRLSRNTSMLPKNNSRVWRPW